MPDRKQCPNLLAGEKSLYLRQHSLNPVAWRPWGEEAFAEARRLDRPLMVSVGYSACHWCHVMAHESFSDECIAGKINSCFIPVKVDREEHPDLDNLFIKAVTAITGTAGWPLTVFLTPDKEPFFGGTYFPPDDRDGMPGLATVLDSVSASWNDDRGEILESARTIASLLTEDSLAPAPAASVDDTVLRKGYSFLQNNFDPVNGGFGTQPKFPVSSYIFFLLRYYRRFHEARSLDMAERSLAGMAAGGIRDHLSGGFHRYSTDERWFLPHFEKMLFDQALLSRAYLEAYQADGRECFADIGKETVDFVITRMEWAEGGFFSSLDADSCPSHSAGEKKEGAFYLWDAPQIDHVLGRNSGVFKYCYGIKERGNIEGSPDPWLSGRNVLFAAHPAEEAGNRFGLTGERMEKLIVSQRKRLLAEREGRPWPSLDRKVLCDWNSLMIQSLCLAESVFPGKGYLGHAQKAAGLILNKMRGDEGELFHCYAGGEARIPGLLQDYAFFTEALIDLYTAAQDHRYLAEATRTAGLMCDRFRDPRMKGFFISDPGATERRFLQKEIYDSAIPSGAAYAVSSLLRLGEITGRKKWKDIAFETVDSLSGGLMTAPYSCINFLVPLFRYFEVSNA